MTLYTDILREPFLLKLLTALGASHFTIVDDFRVYSRMNLAKQPCPDLIIDTSYETYHLWGMASLFPQASFQTFINLVP